MARPYIIIRSIATMNIPEDITEEKLIEIAKKGRQWNLDKIYNFCYKTLGPTATPERMETCYELYNATMALGEKSFSLYLKNRGFRRVPEGSQSASSNRSS